MKGYVLCSGDFASPVSETFLLILTEHCSLDPPSESQTKNRFTEGFKGHKALSLGCEVIICSLRPLTASRSTVKPRAMLVWIWSESPDVRETQYLSLRALL